MSWIDDRIEDYRSRLHPDDRDRFDNRYEDALDALDKQEIHDELEANYSLEEDHLELVMAIASAFGHQPVADGYDTGYRFAFTEPLEEQNHELVGEEGVRNGDVLLVKEENGSAKICIVECKAGSSAGRDWVQKLQDIEVIINTDGYRETLKEQLGVDQIVHEQYVLCGKVAQIVSMDYDRLDGDLDIPENYAFWGYDLGDQRIMQVYGNVRDGQLAGAVHDTMDAGKIENPIELTFGDHTLIQLKVLVERLITEKKRNSDDNPFEFTRDEFYNAFDDELQVGFTGDIREEIVGEKVDSLLDAGEDIGLFTTDADRLNTSRDYRILFQGKTIRAVKRAAEDKYFKYNAEVRWKERAFNDVRSDFRPEQTRLSDRDWLAEEDKEQEEGEDSRSAG
jgi:hypothetical protein